MLKLLVSASDMVIIYVSLIQIDINVPLFFRFIAMKMQQKRAESSNVVLPTPKMNQPVAVMREQKWASTNLFKKMKVALNKRINRIIHWHQHKSK